MTISLIRAPRPIFHPHDRKLAALCAVKDRAYDRSPQYPELPHLYV